MENLEVSHKKTKNRPSITICIPVYNGALTLRQALDSVYSVSPVGFYVIVVDNNSTDGTAAICREYSKKYPKSFSYYKNSRNLGFSGNYRRCIELVESDYFFLIGADDFLYPREVLKLASYLDANPSISLVDSDLVQFYNNPKQPTRKLINFNKQKKEFKAGDDALTNWVLKSVLGSLGGYLVRSEIAKKYRTLIPQNTIVPQIFLGMFIASNHNITHLPVCSFAQRLTDDSTQLANKQYLSLDIISDHFKAIDLVTNSVFESQVRDKPFAKTRLLDTYCQGLVENIVSYRCFASFSLYLKLVRLIPKYSKRQLFSIRYLVYLATTFFVPRIFLIKMLRKFRRQGLG